MILVADFGGTHARAALARSDNGQVRLERMEAGELQEGQTPADWLRQYFLAQGRPTLRACIACAAGPVEQGPAGIRRVRFTNKNVEIDTRALAAASGSKRAELLNDFEAVAYSLPALAPDQIQPHGETPPGAPGTRLALGPGTGLGLSAWIPTAGGVALAGEGGHVRLAPGNAREANVLAKLADQEGFVSAEDLLCGPGLLRLYRLLCVEAGIAPDCEDAGEVWKLWLAGNTVARNTVALFTTLLGRFAGDMALVMGATGGVYIAGGVIPHWGENFDVARFRDGFETKGRYRKYLQKIASATVTHPQPGMLGLAAYGHPKKTRSGPSPAAAQSKGNGKEQAGKSEQLF
jgi:glucokinase